MTPAGIIGFWAAVMGGVIMYLVAGREVLEALRELWGKRKAPEADGFEAERVRLGLLATAFLGTGVEVVRGQGVTIEAGSGRPLRIALPQAAGPETMRHLLLQTARLRSGGYERAASIRDAAAAGQYRAVLDAALLCELVRALPGVEWSEADRNLAAAGARLRAAAPGAAREALPASGVEWRCDRVVPPERPAPPRDLQQSEGVEQREDLVAEAPRRLTQESEGERGGIFFIRFESIQEWTEDFLDLDRPTENDGDSQEKQNTGVLTRKATLSKRGSASSAQPSGPHGQDEVMLPEWDHRRGAYRPDWCRVIVRDAWESAGQDAAAEMRARLGREVRSLEKQLELLFFHRRRERRQSSGSEVDLAAWVRFTTDLAAGASCDSTRLYRRTRPDRRELVVATLVDLSASTETPCAGRRVVDVERDAIYLLSKAVDKLGDAHAAWGFTSQGPSQVSLFRLKGFDEPLQAAEARLAGLGPYANTRMGAAIRRVTMDVGRRAGRGRLLFVLTDGKPHDDDGYVGDYALCDTRRAIEEARAQGIRVVGIGVGPDAQDGMSRLFAPHFVSVERVESLPKTLAGLYVRVAGHGGRS
jgi:hypothetical protein